jgi:hypothetical protein
MITIYMRGKKNMRREVSLWSPQKIIIMSWIKLSNFKSPVIIIYYLNAAQKTISIQKKFLFLCEEILKCILAAKKGEKKQNS